MPDFADDGGNLFERLRRLARDSDPGYTEIRCALWYILWSICWDPAMSPGSAWMIGHETQWRVGVGLVGLFSLIAWHLRRPRLRGAAMALSALLSIRLMFGYIMSGATLAALFYLNLICLPSLLAVVSLRRRWGDTRGRT